MKAVVKGVCAGWVVGLVACGGTNTQLQDTWASPEAANVQFDKVVAVVITDNEASRRAGEDYLAQRLTAKNRVVAVPSYKVLSAAESENPEESRAKLLAQGFDGAVAIHIVSERTDTEYVSDDSYATPFYTYTEYYGSYHPGIYNRGHLDSVQVVMAETQVHDLKGDQLVWTAKSETKDPGGVTDLVKEVAEQAGKDMTDKGLLLAK